MKKILLLALLCTVIMGADVKAQEVTYVEDPSQGYTFNRFKDNWFITGEIGVGGLASSYDGELGFGKRIMPSFNIGVGKWFSPLIGVRFSADFRKMKGATIDGAGIDPENPADGAVGIYSVNRQWSIGPAADVYLNLTNWWCGYKPDRLYNASLYGGVAAHAQMTRQMDGNSAKWKYFTMSIGMRVGLRECMNRPIPEPEPVKEAPLATIYFPIGSSRVQGVQTKVVAAVANAMSTTDDEYVVTGWADSYTGSAARNQQLREQRADNVVKLLVKNGVDSNRIETATADSNLTEYGENSADLDRAATIEIKK